MDRLCPLVLHKICEHPTASISHTIFDYSCNVIWGYILEMQSATQKLLESTSCSVDFGFYLLRHKHILQKYKKLKLTERDTKSHNLPFQRGKGGGTETVVPNIKNKTLIEMIVCNLELESSLCLMPLH